ncbi:TetR family transcriptional regulator [Rathayibacter sp. PhB152]|uniref:TetR/AcrR family transcriptional regulator n=1 Tax=unclassified Rathayibacter TaxID=2609250 RepID=UPI000F4C7A70|nr:MULTISPECIES: TetR/AcrR family transcriptional regulator [unclassified Rathayibacter]ROQ64845.1 TetR family transcriptional regulator [Rathayibacter sp. PhB152]ROS23473.1 TetR family transcriptional regulator [Rathayibacter sp. PhB127]
MASAPPGRPRASGASLTGLGTRADILAASAALFCTEGFGGTSTHAIAAAAGIRQASLYHHFGGKHAVLLELLLGTVQPSLDAAAVLLTRDEPPAARLWALCVSDARLLAAGEHNVGALYLLPELGDERFAVFRDRRSELETAYRTLVAACGAVDPATGASLVLALVENVILQRRRQPAEPGPSAEAVALAALRVLDLPRPAVAEALAAGPALLAHLR